MVKKLILIFILLAFPLTSQIKIVTTLHPFKEIIHKVTGARGEVISILEPGSSPHSYEVSPSEVKDIESAAVLFYGSEKLDSWALNFDNKNKIEFIKLLPRDSLLSVKMIDGEIVGTDPHFWTDPLLVKLLAKNLAEVLCKFDPEGCAEFNSNAKLFSDELNNLYTKIESKVSGLKRKNILLSHQFFAYFLHRFNFSVTGLIEPIPGKEPTAKDLKKIIDITFKKNVEAIFIHSQLPEKPAEIVSESTGVEIFTLDPIGGKKGRLTYEDLLLYNTEIILDALK
ncbi:MAG: metal ABC transporter substrate-binding protein [Ignavibacteria bacterium]|nr:metal ABC transporter substrate-binding protein [Ignavibacteria bacterium]